MARVAEAAQESGASSGLGGHNAAGDAAGSVVTALDAQAGGAATSSGRPSLEWIGRVGGFTERYLLSATYGYLTWWQWGWLRVDWNGIPTGGVRYLSYFSYDCIMLSLNLIMGLVLLFGRRAAAAPRNLRELLVPLATSFYFVIFNYVDSIDKPTAVLSPLVASLVRDRVPAMWQDALVVASFLTGAMGIALATWAIIALGRSFGIFVAVRSVVLRGPFRFVRHPMYCGYIIGSIGLLCAQSSIALAILVPIQIALFTWRAKLEEARLAEFSEAYRAHQRRTGFFYPKADTPAFWIITTMLVMTVMACVALVP